MRSVFLWAVAAVFGVVLAAAPASAAPPVVRAAHFTVPHASVARDDIPTIHVRAGRTAPVVVILRNAAGTRLTGATVSFVQVRGVLLPNYPLGSEMTKHGVASYGFETQPIKGLVYVVVATFAGAGKYGPCEVTVRIITR